MWKKILLKIIVRTVLFVILFTGTALIVNFVYNRGQNEAIAEMTESGLPEIYFEYDGYRINRIPAYLGDMNISLMHESIIPVDADGAVKILVTKDNDFMENVSYELRDLQDGNLIENGTLQRDSGFLTSDFYAYLIEFRMNLTKDTEYKLTLNLTDEDGRTIHYYTKVIRLSRDYTSLFINYAKSFNESTFRNEGAFEGETSLSSTFVDTSMQEESENAEDETEVPGGETASGTDTIPIVISKKDFDKDNVMTLSDIYSKFVGNTKLENYDLGEVDLTSTYQEVVWANLNPERVTEIVPVIRETGPGTALVENNYVARSVGENGETYYKVREAYRLIYNSNTGRPDMSDYKRSTMEVYDGTKIDSLNNAINIGINDSVEISVKNSENLYKTAFVTGGNLWLYDYKKNEATCVFSNLSRADINLTALDGKYGINILSVDDDGNIYFAVYGRINRGIHEGENGIILYKFDPLEYSIGEMAFIQSTLPYDVLSTEAGKFMYYDIKGRIFYTILNDCLMAYNLSSKKMTVQAEGLPASCIYVSEDKKTIAYPDTSVESEVKKITIRNFEEDKTEEREVPGKVLSILGFIKNDLVYGAAFPANVKTIGDDTTNFYFSILHIISDTGEMLKTYSKQGILVSDYLISGSSIYLKRVTVDDEGGYKEASDDRISCKSSDDEVAVTVSDIYDKIRFDEKKLCFPAGYYISYTPNSMVATTSGSGSYIYKPEEKVNTDYYYVYSIAGLTNSGFEAGKAIGLANELKGTVLTGSGIPVYRRTKSVGIVDYNSVAGTFDYFDADTAEDTYAACLRMALDAAGYGKTEGELPLYRNSDWKDTFTEASNGKAQGLNISGTELETALEYLSENIPFAVKLNDRYVMVVSFNSRYIRYYDPLGKGEIRVGRRNFKKEMQKNGNEVYTFWV